MRLLVLSSWFPYPATNGSKLRAWHLLRQLSQRHEIVLASFAEPGEAQLADLSAIRAHCAEVRVVAGNPHKPEGRLSWRGLWGRTPRSYAQSFSTTMADHVARLHRRCDAAIGFEIGAALYLGHVPQVPCVFEGAEASIIRDTVTSAHGRAQRFRRALTWRKYAAFIRRLVASCSRTTAVSDAERGCLIEAGCDGARVAVVPNGVDAACLGVDEPKIPDSIIYPGAMTYRANFDAVRYFLSEIYPLVRRTRPGVRLSITGAYDGVRLEDLPLDGVELTGLLPDVRSYVARSCICVVPLRQGSGTRLKILEAMALGTPVVSTSKGAEGLDVRDGEHLLLADAPETFARSVIELLANPQRADALASNARRLIDQRYTWDRIGRRLEHVLQEAVETPREARLG